jgi:hypothetical protein
MDDETQDFSGGDESTADTVDSGIWFDVTEGGGGDPGEDEFITTIPNAAKPGEPGYGWTYYSNGIALAPTGEAYYQGSEIGNAGNSSGIAKFIADAAKALGLKSPAKLAALAGAAGSGLSALLNKGGGQRPTGYMGSIPSYAAVREQVPYEADSARRPGSAGRQYFTDVKYVSPTDAATAQAAAKQEAEGIAGLQQPVRAAAGGLMGLKSGKYLNGATDGMADEVPAKIEDSQEARLSHGEFVIPADVVSHIGNGNSEAGAKRLYDMMARLRKARTGTPRQGKKINPDKFMPA